MAYTIAVAGKGGVGKTTVSTLLIRHLLRIGGPVLAIDADPNSNLNVLLGYTYKETIADIREETRNLYSQNIPRGDFFNMRLQEIIVEGEGLDLLVMGRPEGPGCYCAVNNILREYLKNLSANYRFIVIDSEAGMEHLSRRTADNTDLLLLVTDSTNVGIISAINAFYTAKKANFKFKDAGIVINKTKGPLEQPKIDLIRNSGLSIKAILPFMEKIEGDSEKGLPLVGLYSNELSRIFDNIICIPAR